MTAFSLLTACQIPGDTKPRTSFYGALTESDIDLARSALQDTLETRVSGEPGNWQNGTTGIEGSVTPLRTYRIASGTYCRDYQEIVTGQESILTRSRTACRDANGVWIPVES
ncbi:MAG: RT0821/Lpp0805 family surface protein [Alphaproteobacteria bacterium]